MAKINLLPWRDELRKELQQQFYVTVGTFIVITLCVWGAIHFINTQRIEYQQTRNQFLNDQIAHLDKKIKEIERLEKEKERLKTEAAAELYDLKQQLTKEKRKTYRAKIEAKIKKVQKILK